MTLNILFIDDRSLGKEHSVKAMFEREDMVKLAIEELNRVCPNIDTMWIAEFLSPVDFALRLSKLVEDGWQDLPPFMPDLIVVDKEFKREGIDDASGMLIQEIRQHHNRVLAKKPIIVFSRSVETAESYEPVPGTVNTLQISKSLGALGLICGYALLKS